MHGMATTGGCLVTGTGTEMTEETTGAEQVTTSTGTAGMRVSLPVGINHLTTSSPGSLWSGVVSLVDIRAGRATGL